MKQIVAGLTLDKQMLQEIFKKSLKLQHLKLRQLKQLVAKLIED